VAAVIWGAGGGRVLASTALAPRCLDLRKAFPKAVPQAVLCTLACCRAARLGGAVAAAIWGADRSSVFAGYACLRRMAGLQTPLGGEVHELIRQRNPSHFTIW
jgi:hypothetical protein